MAHPYHHALSSAKRFGGNPEDYLELHHWFDATKAHLADARHRLLRHHSLGIFIAEQKFGITLLSSSHRSIPVRPIAEQHVQEDFSFIPSVAQCFANLKTEPWMLSNDDHDVPSLHAQRSAKKFGGMATDYLELHKFLEVSRLHVPDARHRVLLHTSWAYRPWKRCLVSSLQHETETYQHGSSPNTTFSLTLALFQL